jgi:ComEC/Rec2-related protein
MSLCLIFWYVLSFFTLTSFEKQREAIGTLVGWEGFTKTIRGQVWDLLRTGDFSHTYRVTVESIDDKEVPRFDVSFVLPPNLTLFPGDSLTAIGKFSFPRDSLLYKTEKQLWNRGLVAEFRSFQHTKTPPKKYSIFVRIRLWLDTQLSIIFPPIGHDILSGILLWQRTNLDSNLRESLKASGLMHIMVVSGSNVMMLIIFLSLFLRSFLPWIRILIIGLTILVFVVLVGGDVPVWRAALMGVIGYSVSLWWYRFLPLLLPFFVATLLALMNPLSLVYDIGFQLSFMSVICIIAFGKHLTKFFHFLGSFFDEAMALTVAATLGTFPITVFYFWTFSLFWPLANLLAAPAIPLLMYSGILTLFVSSFSLTGAYFIGYISWVIMTYLTKIIYFFWGSSSLIVFQLGEYRWEFLLLSLFLLWIFIVCFSKK